MTAHLPISFGARSLFLAALAALLVTSGCSSCAGCGAEEKAPEPDVEEAKVGEPDVEEDTREEDLAEAREAAQEEAVNHAVKLGDQARMLAAELEGANAEQQDVPRTRQPKTKAAGRFENPGELRAVFDKHEGELRKCYERALKRNQSLAGKVTLSVRIEPSGRASSTNVIANSMQKDGPMFECMKRQAEGWRYPQPSGGAAIVKKPFQFSPDM